MKQKIDRYMWLKSIKVNKRHCVYVLIIASIFYAMNCYTPLYSDDWHYNFIYGTIDEINSLYDILYSQYIHYNLVNGRFIPHFFVELFDGILGKSWFNFINTIIFIVYLYLLSYTVKSKSYYKSTSLSLFLIFLMTGFANSMLWMSGACNYLWVAVLLLLFNLLFNKKIQNKCLYPILFLVGIICGWTNEALVVGVGAGYFVYFICNRKKMSVSQIWLLVGFYLGALMLVFAPGSINRASLSAEGMMDFSGVLKSYLSALMAMNNLRLMFLLILLLVIGGFKNLDKVKFFIKENYVLFVAIIVTFVLVLLTKHDSSHSRFGIELFSLILICRWFVNNIHYYVCHILNVVTFTICVFCLGYMSKSFADYKNIISQITTEKVNVITTNKVEFPSFFDKYIIKTDFYTTVSSEWIENHFKKDELIFLPRIFIEDFAKNPNNYKDFYTLDNLWFYAKEITDETSIYKVNFILKPFDKSKLPFYIRPFASKFQRYSMSSVEGNYVVVNYNGSRFIIVKKNVLIDDRVEDVVIL